jgi:hypothetical protein
MSTGLGQAKLQANMMSQQVTGHSECIHVDNNIGSKARQKVVNVSEERTTLYMYTCIVGNQW